ncbi:circadian locomoter output cycles protein kaput [Plakobranchus ocellatus]|uniref:Circadian locomoter output cycles protein kaput n=1 Tax=Plakobranchus ocellatus TaxID=259542 RepID=A0AAV3Y5S6_9GAST|nr:circadian locomoter output cycles protein kaput [Plakobranchus ocellatus]
MNYGKKIALFRPSSRNIESESVLSFDDLDDDDKDNVKRKTRNLSEKKRRDQFNVLINELCSMVSANTKKLDKSSVLKSAIQFLRNHQEFSVQSAANEIKEDWKPTFLCNEEFAQLMFEAVDSFLVVFNHHGKVLFTSDSVTSLLGHLPTDLINNSLYDLMHEDDRLKFFSLLSKHQSSGENFISFTCHLRRGTIDLTDPVTYECVRVMGNSQIVSVEEGLQNENGNFVGGEPVPGQALCFCCTVRLQTSHIIREMANVEEATSEFTSRHSLEWKFLFLDHRAPPIIGYLPFEVLGTSGYDYYHPDDLEVVSQCHEQLMVMGKGTSSFYRFLTKGQQWIWLQTRYYITYHQWNSKPEFIVCTNKVVSYQEVRRQMRQDMGYTDGDSITTAANSTTTSNSNSSSSSMGTLTGALGDRSAGGSGRVDGLQQEGHVTSYSHSDGGASRIKRQKVQSPDVASSHYSDGERPQQPHSTKQESTGGGGNNSEGNSQGQKRVSSQLQSLLQMHLQRSQAAAAAGGRSSASAPISSTAANGVSLAPPPLSHGASSTQALASSAHMKVTSSFESTVMSPTQQQQVSISQARVVPQLMPLMASVPSSVASASTNQRSPSGLILTPAQQLLHEQLVHKSEQLQNAIQCQQEELRLIKEQLAYSSGNVSQQGHMQLHRHQQPRLQQPQNPHQQHQQAQLQGQHQYILPQRLAMAPRQMVVAQRGVATPQLGVMEGGAGQIFLSHMAPVSLNMPTQAQQQQQQQQQREQQHHQVLLHGGNNGQSMLLTSNRNQGSQLAMMGGRPSRIFLSPINVDQLHQQQPQQHHAQPQQTAQHHLQQPPQPSHHQQQQPHHQQQ